jgi:hypothetical protein
MGFIEFEIFLYKITQKGIFIQYIQILIDYISRDLKLLPLSKMVRNNL